jgi:phosphoglycerate dehydrogenase-like enzyme
MEPMISLGIFAKDEVFQDPEVQAQLREGYDVHSFHDWGDYDSSTLLNRMRSVEVAITGRASPKFPTELAKDLGHLRYLCHCHGTIRHLASKELIEAGLIVTNWGDAVEGVAEGAMAMLLCMLKQLTTLNEFAKGGEDRRIYQAFRCSLRGLNVGLYGFGPIGRHMARMLEPFGAKIAIYDPYAKDVPSHIRRCESLRELFATCQAISIHCGLNDQTKDSVTRDLLELLPQGGILINTARGQIVDERALGDLVGAGRLLAGLDVIYDEHKWDWQGSPVAPNPGSLLTLHKIGGGKGFPPDQKPKPELPDFVLRNLAAYRNGQPLINVITAEVYDTKT